MIHEPLAPVKTAELSDGAQFYTQILSDLEDAIRILPADRLVVIMDVCLLLLPSICVR